MILKHKSLNLSTNMLNKQVEISQTKGIYSKLESHMTCLYNKSLNKQ